MELKVFGNAIRNLAVRLDHDITAKNREALIGGLRNLVREADNILDKLIDGLE